MPTTERHALRIERHFNATRERVFAAWTDPAQLRQWSAPVGLRCAEGRGDVAPGGRWEVLMVNDADGTRHHAVGTYLEVEPPRWLKYTHAWQQEGESFDDTASRATLVTMELFAEGDRTRMVFTQTGFETLASRDGHHGGWSSCFDRLDDLVHGRPVR